MSSALPAERIGDAVRSAEELRRGVLYQLILFAVVLGLQAAAIAYAALFAWSIAPLIGRGALPRTSHVLPALLGFAALMLLGGLAVPVLFILAYIGVSRGLRHWCRFSDEFCTPYKFWRYGIPLVILLVIAGIAVLAIGLIHALPVISEQGIRGLLTMAGAALGGLALLGGAWVLGLLVQVFYFIALNRISRLLNSDTILVGAILVLVGYLLSSLGGVLNALMGGGAFGGSAGALSTALQLAGYIAVYSGLGSSIERLRSMEGGGT